MPVKKSTPLSAPLFEIDKKGRVVEIEENSRDIQLHYEHPNGKLFLGDTLRWLSMLAENSVDLIFADPPYNIKKAEWDNFESQESYIEWSLKWIKESARILKHTGSIYVCGFSEILADLKHPASRYFRSCRWLVWYYRNKANLGSDWGRSHESILHFRKSESFSLEVDRIRIAYGNHTLKYPIHPQAETSNFGNGKHRKNDWIPNPLGAKPKDVIEIPTTCNGMDEKTPHPTQKPEELLRKLILAASNEEQIVLDPFSGSGTTLVVSEQLGRKWLGCDNNAEYNTWAINRIENVRKMSVAKWIDFDRKNACRREEIR
ncbi:MAG: DNA methyltransferase [Chloroflexota bacterium]|jgi:site-specific DNA-methyltransferase (adenine-specific)